MHVAVVRHSGAHRKGDKAMTKGIVKWFNDSKGYGFITPEGADKDIFVHYSAIEGKGFKSLKENDKVEFEIADGDKGKQATNVRVI